jgi:hypothetical protein
MPPAPEPIPALAQVAAAAGVLVAVPGALVVAFGALWLPILAGSVLLAWDTETMRILALVCLLMAVPILHGVGAVRLLRRRGRWPSVAAAVPTTVVVAWFVHGSIGDGDPGAWLLPVLLVPVTAPFLALAPSVGRWLAAAPQGHPAHSSTRGTALDLPSP